MNGDSWFCRIAYYISIKVFPDVLFMKDNWHGGIAAQQLHRREAYRLHRNTYFLANVIIPSRISIMAFPIGKQ